MTPAHTDSHAADTHAAHGHDHGHATIVPQDSTVDVGSVRKVALIASVIGLAAWLILGFINLKADSEYGVREFFLTYLCGFIFWSSLPFGGLAMTMIGFLAQASWAVLFRRIFGAAIRTLPVFGLLGVPIVVSLFIMDGKQSPFWWSDHEWTHVSDTEKAKSGFAEKVEMWTKQGWSKEIAEVAVAQPMRPEQVEENQHKIHDYLNPGFFSLRYIIMLGVLGVFGYFVTTWSRPNEDQDDRGAKSKLYGLSGPGVLLWALLMAMFSTDWVMSVEPTWASSMFPIVFGMNQFLCTLTLSTFVFYTLTKGKTDLTAVVKDKFRIDIGSLTLGFCMVWSYASFCQFMLVWAGNLPEEIPYYLKRGAGQLPGNSWVYLLYILIILHWLVPFIVLLFREVKLNPRAMRVMAVFLLSVCACDVVFWIIPSVPHENTVLHVPMAFAAILGVGGIWGLAFASQLGKRGVLSTNHEVKFLAEWGHH